MRPPQPVRILEPGICQYQGTSMTPFVRVLVVLNGWIIAVLLAAPACADSKAEPTYDVHVIDAILRRYVNDSGLVDYRDLQQDRASLDAFVAALGPLAPETYRSWSDTDRMAFLINAYNAITLQRIIDHYPIKRGGVVSGFRFPESSIRQIDGVWDRLTTPVLGKAMTLDHIEHEILRKEFREPRLHAALVCAAMGCPPLRPEAYTGDRLNEQLDDQSRRFLGVPHRFQIDRERKTVLLSPILKWYGGDFTGAYNSEGTIPGQGSEVAAVLDYASRYVTQEDAAYIRAGGYRVDFLEYDWSLNEQR